MALHGSLSPAATPDLQKSPQGQAPPHLALTAVLLWWTGFLLQPVVFHICTQGILLSTPQKILKSSFQWVTLIGCFAPKSTFLLIIAQLHPQVYKGDTPGRLSMWKLRLRCHVNRTANAVATSSTEATLSTLHPQEPLAPHDRCVSDSQEPVPLQMHR